MTNSRDVMEMDGEGVANFFGSYGMNTKSESAQPSRVIRDLAKAFKRFGSGGEKWAKGLHGPRDARCCVIEAVSMALGPMTPRSARVLDELRITAFGSGGGWLHNWNDAPGRTFADVTKLFGDTQARLLQQGTENKS